MTSEKARPVRLCSARKGAFSARSLRVLATVTSFGTLVACSTDTRSGNDDDAGSGNGGHAGTSNGKGGNRSDAGEESGDSSSTGGTPQTGATGGRGGTTASGGSGSPPARPVAPTCSVAMSAAPEPSWKNVTANLTGMASECGNLTLVAADPCKDRVIAGVAKGGLWETKDSGGTWAKLGSGAGSAAIVHRPSSIVFDPEHPDVFYESGIYGALNDGIYRTTDGGTTFEHLGTIGHNDLVSVDFGDPARKTLLAGSHETKQRLYLSTDSGANWTDIGPRLPAGSHFSSAPLVLDSTHFLLGACGYGDGTCGVFASNDKGQTWKPTSTESVAGRPLWAIDGHLLWTTIYDTGAITSHDDGQSWSGKSTGPHTGFPVELPDGRVVAVGADHLLISADGGTTWSNIGEALPYAPAGVTYSTSTKTFYVWRNDCGNAVLSNAVMSAGFDYEK